MTKKVTPWFPMSVHPVRRGRYMVQTETETGGWWVDGLWDGKKWYKLVTMSDNGYQYKTTLNQVVKRWRGITFDYRLKLENELKVKND